MTRPPKRPRDGNQLAKMVVDIATLRVTPAMAAGVSTKLWEIGDIAKLVENVEKPPMKRGRTRKL